MTIFALKVIVKSGLEKIILKFHMPFQSCCCPVQKICPEGLNWPSWLADISEVWSSVPTDRRSFRTGPKKILEDRSVQDLKIAKRTCKDLFFDPGDIIRFFKMNSLEF